MMNEEMRGQAQGIVPTHGAVRVKRAVSLFAKTWAAHLLRTPR